MKLEEYNNFYHVDISCQINNKWKNDTVLGIVKNEFRYSIKIRGRNKELIKRRFIVEDNSKSGRRHNKKVIAIIYSYLLFRALLDNPRLNNLLLCRDCRPETFIINSFQKIAALFKRREFLSKNIKFRKRILFETKEKLPKSLAGKYTRKVYKGKIRETKILEKRDIEELVEVISKIL